jgi:hypothetical protein
MNLKELDEEIRWHKEENWRLLEDRGVRGDKLCHSYIRDKERRQAYLNRTELCIELTRKRWENTPDREMVYKWVNDNDVGLISPV